MGYILVFISGVLITKLLMEKKEKTISESLKKVIGTLQNEITRVNTDFLEKVTNFNKTISILNEREQMLASAVKKLTEKEMEADGYTSKEENQKDILSMDDILDKITRTGFDSLNEKEVEFLKRLKK